MLPVRTKLENTINALLDKALPNEYQKFKIYKLLASYYDYEGDYYSFNSKLFEFYSIPRKKRCDKKAGQIFNVKLTQYDYQFFGLGFHNSTILHHDIFSKATDLKWLMTENFKLPEQITTAEIFFATLVYFNKPSCEQIFLVECEDFLDSWKQVCFTRFGNRFEKYIDDIYPLISKENSMFEINIEALGCFDAGNTTQLTQTEIDWIEGILKSLEEGGQIKTYPGPLKVHNPKLVHLNHHVITFNKLRNSPQGNYHPQFQILVNSLVALCKELIGTDREENLWNVTHKSRES